MTNQPISPSKSAPILPTDPDNVPVRTVKNAHWERGGDDTRH
jgi:hypothetical protein